MTQKLGALSRRSLSRSVLWLGVFLSGAAMAQTCPPLPSQPTPEQIQTLAREAKDRGFLWKFEKDGRTGYLYGSIHLGKQAWAIPGPKTVAAASAADVIALELDILDPAIQAQMADPSKFGIKPIALPPALQARMEAAARKACVPTEALAKMHPVMQLVLVNMFDARFAELEIGYGTEIFFAGFARKSNLPVVSLESVESQMRALLSGADVASIERALAVLEKGRGRAVATRMTGAWADGNLNDLQNYQKWCECADTDAERRMLQRLNDERNPALAAGIDKIMRGGKSVFAAVGALHMTGPKALPKLLQEMGYKLERVAFDP